MEDIWLQEKLKQVFDNLIQLDHANLVKFHKYWTDTKGDKRRVSGQFPGNFPVDLTWKDVGVKSWVTVNICDTFLQTYRVKIYYFLLELL